MLLILLVFVRILILPFWMWSRKPECTLDREPDGLDTFERDLLERRMAKLERAMSSLDQRVLNVVSGAMQEVMVAVEKVQGSVDQVGTQVSKIPATMGSSIAKLKLN